MSLEGRVAVVTGATRGLGKAVADGLRGRGVEVAAVARGADRFRADVSDPAAVAKLGKEVQNELGTPTILVNAAGVFGPIEPLTRADPGRWIETLMVDAVGPYLTCREFVPGMLRERWGRIVNLTSAASLHPPGALGSAYATAKVALNQLTRHLAAEVEGTGVTANVIHPGDVKTEMWEDIRAQAGELGAEGDALRQWVDWVEETGGDPPRKTVDLVLRILESDISGRFLWIEDPLQPPLPSWGEDADPQPWRDRA
jgi:NAD(P)-dependent dehydrogenase (short-subunit alcohol dehydrogenase family)